MHTESEIHRHNIWCTEIDSSMKGSEHIEWGLCVCGFLFDTNWCEPNAREKYLQAGIQPNEFCVNCIHTNATNEKVS